jgi:hypothetical protein
MDQAKAEAGDDLAESLHRGARQSPLTLLSSISCDGYLMTPTSVSTQLDTRASRWLTWGQFLTSI